MINNNRYSGQVKHTNEAVTSNTTLWIILGSIIAGLVIVMGGCVVGSLVGLSTLSDKQSSHWSSGGDGGSRSGALAGAWKGTLSCDDGDSVPVVMKFADSGNPLYDYQTSSGLKEVELSKPGQSLRFVPPGGGVTSIVLDEISVSSDRMSHTMTVSQERAAGGTMIQSRSRNATEAVMSGDRLEVKVTFSTSSAASQPGYVVPDESVIVCQGSLDK